jgi:hypothetical protein
MMHFDFIGILLNIWASGGLKFMWHIQYVVFLFYGSFIELDFTLGGIMSFGISYISL